MLPACLSGVTRGHSLLKSRGVLHQTTTETASGLGSRPNKKFTLWLNPSRRKYETICIQPRINVWNKKRLPACQLVIKQSDSNLKYYIFCLTIIEYFTQYLPAPIQSKFPLQPTENCFATSFGFIRAHSERHHSLSHWGYASQNGPIPRSLQRITLSVFLYEEKYLLFLQSPSRSAEEKCITHLRSGTMSGNKPAPRTARLINLKCHCRNYYGQGFPRWLQLRWHPLTRDS